MYLVFEGLLPLLMKKYLITASLFVLTCLGAYLSSCKNSGDDKKELVSYNFDVRPIFSDKCFKCHGPDANKREAGLRLDIAEEAYKALTEHPRAHAIVPFEPDLSEVFQRINTTDTSILMPPASSLLPTLTTAEVETIRKWIKQGAKYEKHWAFIPPRKPAVPAIENTAWAINEIDHFIAAAQEKNSLKPNPDADKERLAKRAYFDLTGLLPEPSAIDSFVNDKSPNAYEKLLDKLLAMPAYGERMALPWLDVARYADSHGYQDDNYRTQWPWRDWIINAYNRNLSYKDFVTWQLAGDLLPGATKEQILATGFNRNHKITEEGGVINEEYRVEYVTDRTNSFGKSFIGVTIECAKCHDHKYDPFSQQEYFQLYAFFNNITEVGLEATVGGPETYAKNPRMQILKEDMQGVLKFLNRKDTSKIEVSVMHDRDTARQTFVLNRGSYDAPTTEVFPSTPSSILSYSKGLPQNRLGLAKWLFNDGNPLTARVYVNRVWQEIFGKGIVRTVDDFGMQGQLPSHPQLLDWLAVDFKEHGWDVKRLMKQIMMSATYRQSATIDKEKLKKDPDNIFLSYAPRIRMPAELVRDMLLGSSGLLSRTIGGPSSKPYQPAGLWEMATSGRGLLAAYRQDHGEKLYRRGIYSFIKRTVPPPAMMIFDASNRDQCEVKRTRTNTPLQALVMMNDPTMLESSMVLSKRLLNQYKTTDEQVREAFRRIVCRHPKADEEKMLKEYYNERLQFFNKDASLAAKTIQVGESESDPGLPAAQVAALMQMIQVIYNLDEAITKT